MESVLQTAGPHRDELATDASVGQVVHVAARLGQRDPRHWLWPSLLALADSGARQYLVLLEPDDAARVRSLLPRGVHLVVPPRSRDWRPWRASDAAFEALCRLLGAAPMLGLHLHGRAAAALGMRAMRACRPDVPVFFHGSDLVPWLGGWRRWLAAPYLLATLRGRSHLAFVVQEGQVASLPSLRRWGLGTPARRSAEVRFGPSRAEADQPLVVTRGHHDDLAAAHAFAQLAVLFAGHQPSVTFAWLGQANKAVLAVLRAAHIRQVPDRRAAARTAALSSAWLYVAPAGSSNEAAGLVEAMATGLPCVARDSAASADLLIDQLSGFLCRGPEELLARIALLIDDPLMRWRLGAAARERTELRHGRHHFRASLLLAHGLPVRLHAAARAVAPSPFGPLMPADQQV